MKVYNRATIKAMKKSLVFVAIFTAFLGTGIFAYTSASAQDFYGGGGYSSYDSYFGGGGYDSGFGSGSQYGGSYGNANFGDFGGGYGSGFGSGFIGDFGGAGGWCSPFCLGGGGFGGFGGGFFDGFGFGGWGGWGGIGIPPLFIQPPIIFPPIQRPPMYIPPVYVPPPVYHPPVYQPSIYIPPVYVPPTYNPPMYLPPMYVPPAYNPPMYYPPPLVCSVSFSNFNPPLSAVEGQLYSYTLQAVSTTSGQITYRLVNGPDGMTVSQNGLIMWTPAFNQSRSSAYEVRVAAYNNGCETNQTFFMRVVDWNPVPTLAPTPKPPTPKPVCGIVQPKPIVYNDCLPDTSLLALAVPLEAQFGTGFWGSLGTAVVALWAALLMVLYSPILLALVVLILIILMLRAYVRSRESKIVI